jgi:hypothetical protein
MWLCENPDVEEGNWLIVEDVPASVRTETEDDEFDQVEEQKSTLNANFVKNVPARNNTQNHHCQGSLQLPKHVDSSDTREDTLHYDHIDVGETAIHELCEVQFESDQDGVTDDSISALEEPFAMHDEEIRNKEEEKIHPLKDMGVQTQRKSSTQINLNCELITVAAAGNTSVNGVYRWFAAHERFVMFTDHGQYQIMRGVNLPEYGDSYYGWWVIEEIKENVARLYAVASDKTNSISSDGWICINGALPAPVIKEGRERNLHDKAVQEVMEVRRLSPCRLHIS